MDVIKSMQVFRQVAESNSFTGAADKLNIVPSAVSRQISELENWLGRRLIHRTTRSFHLTQDGKEYLSRMEVILNQIDYLKDNSDASDKLSGRVKVTTPVMVGQQDISKVIGQFKAENPDVDIVLRLENRSVNIVEEGYDLAIRSGVLSDSNFYAKKISEISFKTVVSPDYFENRPSINSPFDLSSHNCIVNTALSNSRRWNYKIEGFKKAVKIDGTLETNDAFCILDFAKSGIGVAQLPVQYVGKYIESGDLIEVLEDFALDPIAINLIYPSNRLLSRTTKALIEAILQYYGKGPVHS
ncbi:LysR family transcriptional regulator [Thalassomonas sp. RHCl1]|uniref:LysR family transcriptional regulator n=1 Tax=Thalassomonas sp. RHCl1 TaxID=2995320 RepID=UPI00248CC14D|nr:LysR family transcriptional regulator [Thalassomonas sp. RHCl1]